jgi:predicted nucleotidyltransferase
MEVDQVINLLRQFKADNQVKYSIIKLGIFGSASRGELHGRSDIDIVVELEKPDLFYIVGIKQDLEEQLQCPVDIIRYRNKMNKFLKRRIETEAVYV